MGSSTEIVPHATVAESDEEVLAGIEREIERELVTQLPVKARVERAWLVENAPAGWRRHTGFALERRTSV